MTRFDELCSAYAEVNRQYNSYRHECLALVGSLVAGLREYLGAPEGFVSLFAKEAALAGRKVDGPAAALSLSSDTFFHFGVAIDLFEESGQMPYHCVGFDMRLKRTGDKFILHVEGGPEFQLASNDPAALTPVYEFIFQFVKSRYRESFDEFVLKGDATRRFGF